MWPLMTQVCSQVGFKVFSFWSKLVMWIILMKKGLQWSVNEIFPNRLQANTFIEATSEIERPIAIDKQ